MSHEVRVGLIDSGMDAELSAHVVAATAFGLDGDDLVEARSAAADAIGHGSSVARTILSAAPAAGILSAQVFRDSMTAPPAVIAAALRWLVGRGAGFVNMSFGLRVDREPLRSACAEARSAGTVPVCSTPARGPRVFPAAYPGVIRVCGDARCAAGEISVLEDSEVLFGACPRSVDGRLAGASAAAAHASGRTAGFLADHPGADAVEVVQFLRGIARYHGREQRGGPTEDGASSQTRPR